MTTIILTNELEELVCEKVRSGAYKSADEVVAASLNLLKAQEKGMDALRHEITRGVEDIEQGRFLSLSPDDQLEQFTEKIIKQSLKRARALVNILDEEPKISISSKKENLRAIFGKMRDVEMFRNIEDISKRPKKLRDERE